MIIGNKTICGKLITDLSLSSDRKIKVKCEDCNKERIIIYHNYTISQKNIHNFSGETPCRQCSAKRTAIARRGTPSPFKGKQRPELQNEKSATWKGGTYISSDGYRMIHIRNKNAKSKWEHYKKEHIVLIEQHLKRKMRKGEVIHHINGNKLDNNLTNLVVFSSDKLHRQAHNELEKISMLLVQKNMILFDKTTNKYMAHPKLRELLEQLEEANQQPSPESDLSEGSTTSSNVLPENMKNHERGAECKYLNCPKYSKHSDDIV